MSGPVGYVSNGIVRFALELAALVVLAEWGWQRGGDTLSRTGLCVGMPLLAALLWGQFVAPRAPRYLGRPGRLAVEIGVFGAAVLALRALGHPHVASAFALLAAINTALVHANGHDDQARAAALHSPVPALR